MADTITAADILRYAVRIGQADLVYESTQGMDDHVAVEFTRRLNRAHELGYWTVSEYGLVELTSKGEALVAA